MGLMRDKHRRLVHGWQLRRMTDQTRAHADERTRFSQSNARDISILRQYSISHCKKMAWSIAPFPFPSTFITGPFFHDFSHGIHISFLFFTSDDFVVATHSQTLPHAHCLLTAGLITSSPSSQPGAFFSLSARFPGSSAKQPMDYSTRHRRGRV